jgi:hypothetical protein
MDFKTDERARYVLRPGDHKAWFHTAKIEKPSPPVDSKPTEQLQPPNERIEEAFEQLNQALAAELQEQLAKMGSVSFQARSL